MTYANAQDLFTHVMGAGACMYEWYRSWEETNPDTAEWEAKIGMEDPEYPERTMYVHVTPAKIRSALRYVTENKGKTVKMPSGREYRVWSESLEREVSHLRYNVDEADLDAAVADELLQIVAYGTIIFG